MCRTYARISFHFVCNGMQIIGELKMNTVVHVLSMVI
jgi:hypothetical protein